jgi:hypothetical protein
MQIILLCGLRLLKTEKNTVFSMENAALAPLVTPHNNNDGFLN